MKIIICIFGLLFCLNGIVLGKNHNLLTGDSIALRSAIQIIESKSDLTFYFLDSWIQDYYLTSDLLNQPNIDSLVRGLLKNTSLDYHIIDNNVILLHNTSMVTVPAITKNKIDQLEHDDAPNFLLERNLDQDAETRLNTIGVRNKYEPDGQSTVAGYVKEIQSGNPVEGAFIYMQNPYKGVTTDENGFYSITIPNGKQTLLLQSLNHKNTSRRLMIHSNGKLDIAIEIDIIALNTVVVNANRDENVASPKMGLTKIDPESLKIIPALLGEKDLVRVATTTAGVQFLGEGSSGINIRGGKADQNLFLFDGTPIYNTNHFFGFFSVLNSDALGGVDLQKSSISAAYGGRLSSVFDVKTKSLDAPKFTGTGGIGPVTSRLTLESPIGKSGWSVMVGGRATYSDFVLNKIENSPLKNNNAGFYDLVSKVEYRMNEKNEFSFSTYYSHDRFQLASDTLLAYTDFSYSNALLSFNWKHIFNDKWQTNVHMGSSHYKYGIGYDLLPSQAFQIDFGVHEQLTSIKFDRYINEKLNMNFGAEAKFIKVEPGNKTPTGIGSLVSPDRIETEQGQDLALFASATYNPNAQLSLDIGLRYGIYRAQGPGSVRLYTESTPRDENLAGGTRSYDGGETIAFYQGPEPRISGRFQLNETSAVKGSYTRTRQNIHLLLNSASVAPTDIWRLSGKYIKPQVADQWSIGYYKNFYGKRIIETSIEFYYKHIQNLLDFKVGADLQFNKSIETDMLQGSGKSYGMEVSIKKNKGWLTGWLNYTYSRSLIQVNGNYADEILNGGNYFPTGYDKPHYFNSVTNYKFSRRFTLTLGAIYATGVPVTYPVGIWKFKASDNLLYSERNAFRIPDYFRIDLGINIEGSHKIKKLAHSSWNFSIFNLLGRDNVYSVFFRVEEGDVKGYQLTVFSNPVPTITYNFTF